MKIIGPVQFDPQYRTRWMFPRNIRKIYPWKISQILSILSLSSEDQEWSGNQALQNLFSQRLSSSGLKGDRSFYDIRSGGARTYVSQLEMLGLLYKNENSLFYTIAGSDILDGNPPLPIIQKMLLNIQYPSPYSVGRNVALSPNIWVKPFLFFFFVLREGKLEYLTQTEMQVLLLYGHNSSCANICINKIRSLRQSGGDVLSIIDHPDNDLYTPRTSKSTVNERLLNLKDDANCFKNWLESNMLIFENGGNKQTQYCENPDYRDLITEELRNIDNFIEFKGNSISFQRSFGAYNRLKDIRAVRTTDISKRSPEKSFICSQFYEYCGTHIVSNKIDEFCEIMLVGYGFSRQQVLDSISHLLSRSLDYFASTYFDYSHGGTKFAINFEKATKELFVEYFHYNTTQIGQKRRPDSTIGGYSDVLLESNSAGYFALIDTKASSSYNLSHDDYLKMVHTYIPNYRELVPTNNLYPLKFVCYVAGGFSGNPGSKLKEISKECSPINASAICSMELLNVANDPTIDKDHAKLCSIFSVNKVLSKEDFKSKV